MKNEKRKCPVCSHSKFQHFHTVDASAWVVIEQNIKRKDNEYRLHECVHCNHIMFFGDYSEKMFEIFYPKGHKSINILDSSSKCNIE